MVRGVVSNPHAKPLSTFMEPSFGSRERLFFIFLFFFFEEGSKAYRFNFLVWRQSRSSFNFITDTVQTDQQLI